MSRVSVIILVGDQTNFLPTCLESLITQTIDLVDFDIILVGTISSELENVHKKFDPSYSIKDICRPAGQLAIGLNEAVAASNGEYCLFLDVRVRATPSLLWEHLRVQRALDGIVGLGAVQFPSGLESNGKLSPYSNSRENMKAFSSYQNHVTSWLDCKLENLSIPRKKILETGGFCTELSKGYEFELVHRLEQHGLVVTKVDSAIVTVDRIPSQQDLCKREEERGAVYVELWRKYPRLLCYLFGNFYDTSLRGVFLRRFLIALAASPHWMEMIGRMISNPYLREKWDVFLQQYCFWRGVHETLANSKIWQQLTYGVPILMYHAFCANDERPRRFIHSTWQLRVQLRLLKWLGYRIIGLEEYLEYLIEDDLPPARSVIITIDDGYSDNYLFAYSVLKQFGAPATIFLVSSRLGRVNDWDEGGDLEGRPLLDREQAQEMQDGLITFGAHTRTHPWLQNISVEQASEEVTLSKKELERELGLSVRLFSYPHGDYDDHTVKLVEEAGFLGACTTQTGLNTPGSPRLALHRTEIYGTFSIFRFLVAVWSGK